MYPNRKILVFDDDFQIRIFVERILSQEFLVEGFPSGEAGLEALSSSDLIISDIEMPGMGGRGLHQIVKRDYPEKPFLVITGLTACDTAAAYFYKSGVPVLHKPFTLLELRAFVADSFCRSAAGIFPGNTMDSPTAGDKP